MEKRKNWRLHNTGWWLMIALATVVFSVGCWVVLSSLSTPSIAWQVGVAVSLAVGLLIACAEYVTKVTG